MVTDGKYSNDNERTDFITPCQLRDMLKAECSQQPSELRDKVRLMYDLRKITPEEAIHVSDFLTYKTLPTLREDGFSDQIDIAQSLDRHPITELIGAIIGIEFSHTDPQMNPGGHLQQILENGERTAPGITTEELKYLTEGWKIIQEAQNSSNTLEQIMGYASELALVTEYLHKTKAPQNRNR